MSDIPLIGTPAQPSRTIEVCRSFAYKLNLGNYESADFFCSRKLQCAESDASWVSQQLFEECVEEIRDSIAKFKAERARKVAKREESAV